GDGAGRDRRSDHGHVRAAGRVDLRRRPACLPGHLHGGEPVHHLLLSLRAAGGVQRPEAAQGRIGPGQPRRCIEPRGLMSASRRVLIAAGAWLLCAGAAAQDVLEACAAQASAGTRGIVALEAACPGIEAALRESSLAANLPATWRESLDASALHDLIALEQRYLHPPPPAPDRAGLHAILEQLASEQIEPRRSWWDAVKDWL